MILRSTYFRNVIYIDLSFRDVGNIYTKISDLMTNLGIVGFVAALIFFEPSPAESSKYEFLRTFDICVSSVSS